MTKPAYTAVCLVIDSSGSMESIKSATDETINAFIREQAAAEDNRTIRWATFSAPLWNDNWLRDSELSQPAADVQPFSLDPQGGTALLDAVGIMVGRFGEELAAMPQDKRPDTVVFAIMTDGYENSSREYTWEHVQRMLTHQQEKYNWDVVYLGANQDAIEVGGRLGVSRTSSMTYDSAPMAVAATGISLSGYVGQSVSYSSGLSQTRAAFTDEDREKARTETPKP